MKMGNKKKYYSLPSYFVIFTLFLVFLIRRSLGFSYEIVAISLFLCTAPNLLIERCSMGVIALFEILFLFLLAFILGSKGLIIISIVTVVSVAYTAKLIWQNRWEEIKRWPDILGIFLLAFFAIHYFWFSGYFSLDFETEIVNGTAHKDELLHMAISNMFVNESIPSTGLHFAPYLPYHYLSHLLFGMVKMITGLKIYQVYPYALPFLVLPFFVQFLQSLIRRYSQSTGHFLLLPIFLFGVTSMKSLNKPWNYYFISESYLVGIVVLFAFLYSNAVKPNNWTNSLLIFIGFLAKISVGFLMFCSHLFLIFFKKDSWKRKLTLLFLAFISAGAAYLLTIRSYGGKGEIVINWLHLHKLGFSKVGYIEFFLGRFYAFLLMLFAFLFLAKKKRLHQSDNLVLPIALIAFLLGLVFINLKTAGLYYFVNLSMWVSLPFLLIFSIRILSGKPRISYPQFFLLFLLTFFSFNFFRNSKEVFWEYKNYWKTKPSLSKEGKEFFPYYQALKKAGEIDKRNEYLVEIPKTETVFWEHAEAKIIPFYIPVVAGRPAINAYDLEKIGSFSQFGYQTYWDQKPINLCQDTKYKGIISIAKDENRVVAPSVHDCGTSFFESREKAVQSRQFAEPELINSSFEEDLEGWGKPSDCSKGKPGQPIFKVDFPDDATDGEKALSLISENHNLCINTRIKKINKNQFYVLSFDSKQIKGDFEPSIYLGDSYGELRQLMIKTELLPDSWIRHGVILKPRQESLVLYLYSNSDGEENIILYDNLRIENYSLSFLERVKMFIPKVVVRK